MRIPKTFTRITKNKLHQIYQPGFNKNNSCWLNGAWLTLPKEEWDRIKDDHEKMYSSINAEDQHHRDPETPLEKMTPAQKQAWEYFSGSNTFDCYNDNPKYIKHVVVNFNMAGNSISKKSLDWFKKNYFKDGFKIIKFTTAYGVVTNQVEDFDIPPDLILHNEGDKPEPIDVVQLVIDHNEFRNRALAEETAKHATGEKGDFNTEIALQSLEDLEEDIIRIEWKKSINDIDMYDDLPSKITEYINLRKILKDKFKEAFNTLHDNKSHNECARKNLDSSEGHMYCFVLPKFNDDGSHAPWGDKDVPWGQKTSSDEKGSLEATWPGDFE